MEQSEQGLSEEVPQLKRVDIVAQFVVREAQVSQLDDVRPNEVLRREDPTGLLPRLEHQGQLGELCRTGIDVYANEIVPQDEFGDLGGRVAFLLVNKGEQ